MLHRTVWRLPEHDCAEVLRQWIHRECEQDLLFEHGYNRLKPRIYLPRPETVYPRLELLDLNMK